MAPLVPFTVENVEWGWPNQPVIYRIRAPAGATGGSHLSPVIRYLSASNRPNGASGIPDNHNEFLSFDAVPAGAWNLGRLVPDSSADGKFVLASTETTQVEAALGLLDAGPAWCDRQVDIDDLMDWFYPRRRSGQADDDSQDGVEQRMPMVTDIQCMNQAYAEVLPTPADIAAAAPGPEVIGIWAWQPGNSHGTAAESHAYSIIQARDPGLAARFLGHITENGTRIIGFLLERVVGAREAGPADLEKCTAALSRLHALGIVHGGPLRRHTFLVCESSGGDAVLLQGFGGSFETTDKEVLGRELEGLEQVLAQLSELERFNGSVDMKRSDLMMEFLSHGFMHPFVVFQLGSSGSTTVTAEQHKEMVAQLAANDYNWTEEDMERAKQRFGGSPDVAGVGAASESVNQ